MNPLSLCLILGFADSALAVAPAATPAPVGAEFLQVEGPVTTRLRSGADEVKATSGLRVFAGGSVQTGDAGRTRLKLSDGSLVVLDPKTSFAVEALDTADDSSLRARFRLLSGALWANISKLARPSDVRVHAGGSVIGVRGTNFSISGAEADTLDVAVSEGEVEVTDSEKGSSTTVGAGFAGTFRKAGSSLRELTAREKDRFLDVWKFVPAVRDKIKGSMKAGVAKTKDVALGVGEKATGVGRKTADISKRTWTGFAERVAPPRRVDPDEISETAEPAESP